MSRNASTDPTATQAMPVVSDAVTITKSPPCRRRPCRPVWHARADPGGRSDNSHAVARSDLYPGRNLLCHARHRLCLARHKPQLNSIGRHIRRALRPATWGAVRAVAARSCTRTRHLHRPQVPPERPLIQDQYSIRNIDGRQRILDGNTSPRRAVLTSDYAGPEFNIPHRACRLS